MGGNTIGHTAPPQTYKLGDPAPKNPGTVTVKGKPDIQATMDAQAQFQVEVAAWTKAQNPGQSAAQPKAPKLDSKEAVTKFVNDALVGDNGSKTKGMIGTKDAERIGEALLQVPNDERSEAAARKTIDKSEIRGMAFLNVIGNAKPETRTKLIEKYAHRLTADERKMALGDALKPTPADEKAISALLAASSSSELPGMNQTIKSSKAYGEASAMRLAGVEHPDPKDQTKHEKKLAGIINDAWNKTPVEMIAGAPKMTEAGKEAKKLLADAKGQRDDAMTLADAITPASKQWQVKAEIALQYKLNPKIERQMSGKENGIAEPVKYGDTSMYYWMAESWKDDGAGIVGAAGANAKDAVKPYAEYVSKHPIGTGTDARDNVIDQLRNSNGVVTDAIKSSPDYILLQEAAKLNPKILNDLHKGYGDGMDDVLLKSLDPNWKPKKS